jgi:hypothetical protein
MSALKALSRNFVVFKEIINMLRPWISNTLAVFLSLHIVLRMTRVVALTAYEQPSPFLHSVPMAKLKSATIAFSFETTRKIYVAHHSLSRRKGEH